MIMPAWNDSLFSREALLKWDQGGDEDPAKLMGLISEEYHKSLCLPCDLSSQVWECHKDALIFLCHDSEKDKWYSAENTYPPHLIHFNHMNLFLNGKK